jgi:hypothetical protein
MSIWARMMCYKWSCRLLCEVIWDGAPSFSSQIMSALVSACLMLCMKCIIGYHDIVLHVLFMMRHHVQRHSTRPSPDVVYESYHHVYRCPTRSSTPCYLWELPSCAKMSYQVLHPMLSMRVTIMCIDVLLGPPPHAIYESYHHTPRYGIRCVQPEHQSVTEGHRMVTVTVTPTVTVTVSVTEYLI